MSATKGNGAGTYLFDWEQMQLQSLKSIELTVPGSTTKYAEKYATKINMDVDRRSGKLDNFKRRIAGNMVTAIHYI